jgi:predicted DNA-binding transcriptional regulator AlpA
MILDDLLTTAETAGVLRIKQQTLRAWRAKSRGPRYVKIGSRVVYSKKDVADWAERQIQEPEEGAA